MKHENVALVIIGYDGYCDLWDHYFELMNKFWGNRPYKTYLFNNELDKKYENVITVNCGKEAEWSKKVQKALEVIEEEYICLLLEDFFVYKEVNNNHLDLAINLMRDNDINYYKLNTFSKIKGNKAFNKDYLIYLNSKNDYAISLQPAIWEKEFLKELVGQENYNAWIFEFKCIEFQNKNPQIVNNCVYDSRNFLNIEHGVVQGDYLPKLIRKFNEINYKFDIEKRPIMSGKKLYLYYAKRNLKFLIPKKFRKSMKRLLEKLGFEFISTKYDIKK